MKQKSSAIAFWDAKIAALLNDYVVPVHPVEFIQNTNHGTFNFVKYIPSLLPPSLVDKNEEHGMKMALLQYYAGHVLALPELYDKVDIDDREFIQSNKISMNDFKGLFKDLLNNTKEPLNVAYGLPNKSDNAKGREDIKLSVTGLRIVDAGKLLWPHIIEFRKDEESKRKLRNLQLFLSDNYDGKSEQYIEDSICQKIDEYDQTVKKWGFDTKDTAFGILFSSKAAMACTTAGIASAFGIIPGLPAGASSGVTLLSAVGALFTLGNIHISVGKQKRELGEYMANDPVSYLIGIRDKTANSA